MELIKDKEQLIKNIETLEGYLTEGNVYENSEAVLLIKRGICFVAYQIDKELRFAPSRFIGYIENKIEIHTESHKDGRETNKAIVDILFDKPVPDDNLERMYFDYCNQLGIQPNDKGTFGSQRKFWRINIEKDFSSNIGLTGEFPEGKIVERTHNSRERNYQVISLAKERFKKLHGRLFCQVCEFNFEEKYGEIGKNFIEGHHTIAVSDMTPGHNTKVEDIAMLCANCHRMVHKKRPWLSMDELNELLIKNGSR